MNRVPEELITQKQILNQSIEEILAAIDQATLEVVLPGLSPAVQTQKDNALTKLQARYETLKKSLKLRLAETVLNQAFHVSSFWTNLVFRFFFALGKYRSQNWLIISSICEGNQKRGRVFATVYRFFSTLLFGA